MVLTWSNLNHHCDRNLYCLWATVAVNDLKEKVAMCNLTSPVLTPGNQRYTLATALQASPTETPNV